MSDLLGELKQRNLRTVWKHEEHEFTPWLAKEENLSRLSEAVGLDLQLERTEVPVGPYSADILAREASGVYVVIENQFGRTNHDHLGKLITYGATLGASAVIWIAEDFTEEHRKALEWLNDRTTDDLSLYAVQLEVLQIDDSKPAIRFNVVSQPSEIVKAATAARRGGPLTETQKLQLEFWTAVSERLLERKILTSTHTPRPQYWFDVPLGRSWGFLSNLVDTSAGRIGTRLYLKWQVADVVLAELEKSRGAIEAEIGAPLQWNPAPQNKDKTIALTRSVDLSDRAQWPGYVDWLVDVIVKFRSAFGPRIRALKLDGQQAGSVA